LWKQIQGLGTTVIGISPDQEASHRDFIAKFKLPYMLLCDPEKKVMAKYGAYGEKMMYGKKLIGVIRSTVLIGETGRVIKHWQRVPKAADHAARVLDVLHQL
jgi:peroxiredoxin Q/BCP